tara:strand:+ start:350 stop:745 length:396 start_codon:yes stop_codon:yes gene_type:complete
MGLDFQELLKEYNVTEQWVQEYNEKMDKEHLIEIPSILYYKSKSDIQGIGVFAKKKLMINKFLGVVALRSHVRTTLGRWVNHSKTPNCIFKVYDNPDHPNLYVICKALKNIKKNTEITVNYRSHIKEIYGK